MKRLLFIMFAFATSFSVAANVENELLGGVNIFLSCSYVHGKLYDASGKQINEKDITNTGKADVSIIASDFAPGIYIYTVSSLMVNVFLLRG